MKSGLWVPRAIGSLAAGIIPCAILVVALSESGFIAHPGSMAEKMIVTSGTAFFWGGIISFWRYSRRWDKA